MSAPVAPDAPVVDYDGLVFRPVSDTSATAELPTGHYHQDGELVWAEFAGAHIVRGHLVGRRDGAGVIEAAYCQLGTDGALAAGCCTSTPTVLPDGRVRLTEHWRRVDGSSGVSHIEQIQPEDRS